MKVRLGVGRLKPTDPLPLFWLTVEKVATITKVPLNQVLEVQRAMVNTAIMIIQAIRT